ncbi:helix-turn-helix domain-containing protein [Corynebacterium breve]|uniref:helix-turn-helix domain-containing protein n=1 Tax=Corynebacterium breve TaxID=3049799 RepID=UPI003D78CF9D
MHGISPFTWITHQRVREMARILRETRQPVRDIARAVGWTKQAHAAQQFRKLTRRCPTKYRTEVRGATVVACLWCGQRVKNNSQLLSGRLCRATRGRSFDCPSAALNRKPPESRSRSRRLGRPSRTPPCRRDEMRRTGIPCFSFLR